MQMQGTYWYKYDICHKINDKKHARLSQQFSQWESVYSPGNIYLFKVNYRNIRKRCKICSNLTIKTEERRRRRRRSVFVVNLEHILHLFLVFLLLSLNKYMLAGKKSLGGSFNWECFHTYLCYKNSRMKVYRNTEHTLLLPFFWEIFQ